jgi:hypothetical protein
MSRIEELFKILESHEFSAMVNLASDFRTFIRILGAQSAVQSLCEEMRNPDVRTAVHERALSLVQDEGEAGYEHPWDSALAAYLWLLCSTDAELATILAGKIAPSRGCWWARKMADEWLSSERNGPMPPVAQEEGFTAR